MEVINNLENLLNFIDYKGFLDRQLPNCVSVCMHMYMHTLIRTNHT